MAEIFISYQRAEHDAVSIIAERLRELRIDVWFDEKLRAGIAFDEEIGKQIVAAKAVLTCWTPSAAASAWVRSEATLAREGGKLIACYLAPTQLLPPFNIVHAEDLTAWAGQNDHPGWLRILERAGELLERPGLAHYSNAMRPGASLAELRVWAETYGSDPLADSVWARIVQLEGEDAAGRLDREKAEAHQRDAQRKAGAARLRALTAAREARNTPAAQRSARRRAVAIVLGLIVALGVVLFTLDYRRRAAALADAQSMPEVAEFVRANSWHPLEAVATEKFRVLLQSDIETEARRQLPGWLDRATTEDQLTSVSLRDIRALLTERLALLSSRGTVQMSVPQGNLFDAANVTVPRFNDLAREMMEPHANLAVSVSHYSDSLKYLTTAVSAVSSGSARSYLTPELLNALPSSGNTLPTVESAVTGSTPFDISAYSFDGAKQRLNAAIGTAPAGSAPSMMLNDLASTLTEISDAAMIYRLFYDRLRTTSTAFVNFVGSETRAVTITF